jgi:hypothetical protein
LRIVSCAEETNDYFRSTTELREAKHLSQGEIEKRKGDGPIMSGHASLAKRLCQVSSFAGRIEPLIGLIPEIMERNDQLRPLWTAWRENATPDLTPRQYFNRGEIKLLCDFVEYLYFASDAFARSARTGR